MIMRVMIDKNYLENHKQIDLRRDYVFLSMIFAFSGFFGFFYETLFYWIDLGYIVKRGMTFGPWVPIYGFGALAILMCPERLHTSPGTLFVSSSILCGAIEYITGSILFNRFGVRLWDYNTEIWSWGNINGYVCFRSVLFFGLSALFLLYVVCPFFEEVANRCNTKTSKIIAVLPGALFLMDFAVNIPLYFSQII